MTNYLFWLLPPFIGAFIGYATNLVAIKMLFRPLKEVKLFGIKLPFTPGILPKERGKLADNIGDMIERELLTAEVLRERLAKPEVHSSIKTSIASYTTQLLDRPVESWLATPVDAKHFPLGDLLKDFINSDVFTSLLEEIIKEWIAQKMPTPKKDDNGFSSWFKSRMHDVSAMFIPAARDILKGGFVRQTQGQTSEEASLLYQRALTNVLERYPGITLKEFLSLAEAKKRTTDSFLAEKTIETLDDNIEGALKSISVKALVADRINSLDMIRVEKIILDVMSGQLKWINFFGGFLGALIGFVQVILSLAFR